MNQVSTKKSLTLVVTFIFVFFFTMSLWAQQPVSASFAGQGQNQGQDQDQNQPPESSNAYQAEAYGGDNLASDQRAPNGASNMPNDGQNQAPNPFHDQPTNTNMPVDQN